MFWLNTGNPSLKGVQAVLKMGIMKLKSVDILDKPVTSKYGITHGPHYYQGVMTNVY